MWVVYRVRLNMREKVRGARKVRSRYEGDNEGDYDRINF